MPLIRTKPIVKKIPKSLVNSRLKDKPFVADDNWEQWTVNPEFEKAALAAIGVEIHDIDPILGVQDQGWEVMLHRIKGPVDVHADCISTACHVIFVKGSCEPKFTVKSFVAEYSRILRKGIVYQFNDYNGHEVDSAKNDKYCLVTIANTRARK